MEAPKSKFPLPQQDYMVVVKCFTYNHGKYIEDTLKGFVMQKTNFPFCALVVDDFSSDDTAQIIRRYEERYPEIIKGVYLQENYYSQGGIKREKTEIVSPWFERCKYIAMCEGDDYWIDPLKLQKQVDFLEVNPEYGLTWTKAKRYEQQIEEYTIEIGEFAADFSDLLLKNPIPALTVVFRKDLLFGYDDFFKGEKLLMGDYPRWLYIAERSKIHFIDEVTSVYRFYPGSASRPSRRADLYKFNAGGYAIAMKFCENQEKYSLIYKKLSNNYFYWMSLNSICLRDFSAFSEYWSKFSFKTIQELAYFIGAFLYSFVRR